jgi:hypothetical protein
MFVPLETLNYVSHRGKAVEGTLLYFQVLRAKQIPRRRV